MNDAEHLFQRLCQEAVVACGADIGAIERYVADKMDTMDQADCDKIKRDLQRLLAFRAPDWPARPH